MEAQALRLGVGVKVPRMDSFRSRRLLQPSWARSASGTLVWRGSAKSAGPFESAIFDGKACTGDGHEGIQAVFTERNRIGGCSNDFHSLASPSTCPRAVMYPHAPRVVRDLGSRVTWDTDMSTPARFPSPSSACGLRCTAQTRPVFPRTT